MRNEECDRSPQLSMRDSPESDDVKALREAEISRIIAKHLRIKWGLTSSEVAGIDEAAHEIAALSRTPQPAEDAVETLKWIAAQQNLDRSTVTPENAFEAFGKLNRKICEIYDRANAALAHTAG